MLERYGLEFSLSAVNVDEQRMPGEEASEYALRLAASKARAALSEVDGPIILAGDTVVALDGEVLGKPNDAKEAATMITRLSGKTHQVISAYTLLVHVYRAGGKPQSEPGQQLVPPGRGGGEAKGSCLLHYRHRRGQGLFSASTGGGNVTVSAVLARRWFR